MTVIRNNTPLALVALVALVAAAPVLAGDAAPAQEAFGKLKALEGTWHGEGRGEEHAGETTHVFKVSAAGTVVMHTMDPGGDHEMINMYHLDGDDLVLTHYCAGGNQPTMRLVQPQSSPGDMQFNFSGGTNLDPKTDEHIHDVRLVLVDEDTHESYWTGYAGGKETRVMKFVLKRGG